MFIPIIALLFTLFESRKTAFPKRSHFRRLDDQNGCVFTYAARFADGSKSGNVNSTSKYVGTDGKKITDIAIKVNQGKVTYRVHVLGGSWLPSVTGFNWSDDNNGYAGNHKPIDAIEVTGTQCTPKYRVSVIGNSNFYSYQNSNDKDGGQDGYAGSFGKAIDKFQLVPGAAPVCNNSTTGGRIVCYAQTQLGVPYVYGGQSPSEGFDCSGLVYWCHQKVGIDIPRTASAQAASSKGKKITSWSDLKPGDAVFFAGGKQSGDNSITHTGISLGGYQFIHAPQTGDVVKKVTADDYYYKKVFAYGRRFW